MIAVLLGIILLLLAKWRARNNHALDDYTIKARYYDLCYAFYDSVRSRVEIFYRFSAAKMCLRWIRLEYEGKAYSDVFALLVSQSLVNTALGIVVLTSLIEQGVASMVLLMATASIVLLAALPFSQLRTTYQDSCYRISRAMPGFTHQLAMLVKSGATIESSIQLILSRTAKTAPLFKILGRVQLEQQRGNSLADAFRVMPELVKLKSVHHFSLLMSQVSHTGVHHFSEQLIDLGNMILRDRQTVVKTISEQLSTKLLMPLMVSLITIMALLIYPILNHI